MYINDGFQLNLLLLSVGFGFLLSVIYDLLSLIFGVSRNVFVKDIIYSLISTLLIFVFLLVVNFGRIRVFIVLGTAAGFGCWFVILRKSALKVLSQIIEFVSSVLKFAANVVSWPFRPIIALSSNIWLKIKRFFAKKFEKLKNKFKMHLKKI